MQYLKYLLHLLSDANKVDSLHGIHSEQEAEGGVRQPREVTSQPEAGAAYSMDSRRAWGTSVGSQVEGQQ